MAQKVKETIEVQDAMDNLAAIMSLDLENAPVLGIVKKHRIVTTEEEFGPNTVPFLSGEGAEPILEILDLTYRSIHQHLMRLFDSSDMNWENEKSRQGVASMMVLVGESASKIEKFLEQRLGAKLETSVVNREAYKSLQKFYTQQFARKFSGGIQGDEAWEKEWNENKEAMLLDASQTGLQNFETIRRDTEYELFYIRNENGEPYFNKELLRNIKLSCDFDFENESFEEDPLLKVRAMQDRDLHEAASLILKECYPPIVDFYKIAHNLAENDLASQLSMGIMALMLAANPRYLLQNTTRKSCLQYFNDFHQFLKRAMRTTKYQKLVAYPPDKSDKISHLLLYLTHMLCKGLFERAGGVKLETIGLIYRTMRRGEEIKQKEKQHLLKGETLWNQFLLDDEKFRTLLSRFPNGPLFKILDLIREEQEEDTIIAFDPIGQENLPCQLYEMDRKGKKFSFLRLPSPTRQSVINKVEIIDEFRGFLRALHGEKRQILIINLQDRTSWKEYARCRELEMLQMKAEFNHQLFVITLPKNTDFYHQINGYLNLNHAEEFIKAFRAQLATPEVCGFFFPPQIESAELNCFVDMALPAIHEHFFHNKNNLTRRNREDFIEIFYQFLILKCIDLLQPNLISFTCKDSLDTSAAEQATFYGFVKLLSGDLKAKEEQDFFRWLLYTPALFVRERAVDPERFNRAITALERIDGEMTEERKKILKIFEGL